jgi:hypothetical protein
MAKTKAKPAGNKYKAIGLRLRDEVREKLEQYAKEQRRSVAAMTAIIVEDALKALGK